MGCFFPWFFYFKLTLWLTECLQLWQLRKSVKFLSSPKRCEIPDIPEFAQKVWNSWLSWLLSSPKRCEIPDIPELAGRLDMYAAVLAQLCLQLWNLCPRFWWEKIVEFAHSKFQRASCDQKVNKKTHFTVLRFFNFMYYDFKILICHHWNFRDKPTYLPIYWHIKKRAKCLQNPNKGKWLS